MTDNTTLKEYYKVPIQSNVGPEIEISCCSNVYIRRMTFKYAGIVELGHTHLYDHVSFLSLGSIEVQIYDEENKEMLPPKTFNAPATIFIAKNKVHQIKALEDNTVVSCIHALRDIEGEIISPEMIPEPTSLPEAIQKHESIAGKPLQTPVKDDKFINFRFNREFDVNKSF